MGSRERKKNKEGKKERGVVRTRRKRSRKGKEENEGKIYRCTEQRRTVRARVKKMGRERKGAGKRERNKPEIAKQREEAK